MANDTAWQEGWQLGSNRRAEQREHKQALSDQELEGKINDLIENRKAIQAKLPTLLDPETGKPTPEYNHAIDELTQNAHDLRTVYHRDNNPNAIERFGHLLTDHLGITSSQGRAQKTAAKNAAGDAADKHSAFAWAGAAPIAPVQAGVSEAKTKDAVALEMMQSKMKMLHTLFPQASSEQMQSWQNDLAASITGAKPIPDKYFKDLATTTDAEGKQHYWRVRMDDSPPEEVDFNGQTLVPKNQPKPGTSKFSVNVDSYKKMHGIPADQSLTPDQLNFVEQQIALSSAAPSSNITNTLKQDNNGAWVPIRETNQHIPGFGTILHDPLGSAQSPSGAGSSTGKGQSTPQTLSDVRNRAAVLNPPQAAPRHAGVSVGKPVLQGRTPEYTVAMKDYNTAIGLATAAHTAEKAPPAVKAGLQREIAGRLQNTLEKRFNLQAMDNLISHYGIANNFETWITRTQSGALPDNVFHEIVAMADNNVVEKKAALQSATPPPLNSDQSAPGDSSNTPSNPHIDAIVNIINQKHAAAAH